MALYPRGGLCLKCDCCYDCCVCTETRTEDAQAAEKGLRVAWYSYDMGAAARRLRGVVGLSDFNCLVCVEQGDAAPRRGRLPDLGVTDLGVFVGDEWLARNGYGTRWLAHRLGFAPDTAPGIIGDYLQEQGIDPELGAYLSLTPGLAP
jgi:hypothetical protein